MRNSKEKGASGSLRQPLFSVFYGKA